MTRSSASASYLLIQLRQIGDVVLTTPLARILKEERPVCRVTFLTERPSDQLLTGNPFIDEVILNDRKGSWRDTLRLALALRRRRFNAAFDLMANPRSAILAFASGAPVRSSYRVPGRGILYTHRFDRSGGYTADVKARVLEAVGIAGRTSRPEIFLSEEERGWAQKLRGDLLRGKPRLVTVDPTHRRPTRRWPAEHFGELCALVAGRADAVPVVLWGPGEEDDADEVVAASGGAAVKAPPTKLRQMAALIGAADLHFGNCSAPRHIAVAVGTPTFTVLGSTDSSWTCPSLEHTHLALGLPCQPCNNNRCDRDRACLTGLAPDRVAAELLGWADRALGWTGG